MEWLILLSNGLPELYNYTSVLGVLSSMFYKSSTCVDVFASDEIKVFQWIGRVNGVDWLNDRRRKGILVIGGVVLKIETE